MKVWYIMLLCLIASFADVIGGFLTVFKKLKDNEVSIITSLGAGFLVGATLLDRLPDSMTQLPKSAPVYIALGYLLLLILSKYSTHQHELSVNHVHRSNHHHHNQTVISEGDSQMLINQRAAFVSFISLLIHTFVDGVVIAGAFTINRSTGFLIFMAITFHKIPEGFSMASLYLAAGKSRQRAFLTSTGLALSTLVGAIVTLQLRNLNNHLIAILMAIATGTFLYISTSELVPALKGNPKTVWIVSAGVVIFYGSLLLIQHVGLT